MPRPGASKTCSNHTHTHKTLFKRIPAASQHPAWALYNPAGTRPSKNQETGGEPGLGRWQEGGAQSGLAQALVARAELQLHLQTDKRRARRLGSADSPFCPCAREDAPRRSLARAHARRAQLHVCVRAARAGDGGSGPPARCGVAGRAAPSPSVHSVSVCDTQTQTQTQTQTHVCCCAALRSGHIIARGKLAAVPESTLPPTHDLCRRELGGGRRECAP